jgi:hypothetical protein
MSSNSSSCSWCPCLSCSWCPMTPVYPSWHGNYAPLVLRHEHTKGEREGGDTYPLRPHGNGLSEWDPERVNTSSSRSPVGEGSHPAEGDAAGSASPRARRSPRKAARVVEGPDQGTRARDAERRVPQRRLRPAGGGRRSGPSGPTRTPLAAEERSRSRRTRPGPTDPGCGAARRRPGEAPPGGGAVRPRSGDPIRPHGPRVRSGEARAVRLGKAPRRRSSGLVERSGNVPARGPVREGLCKHEDLRLQGSVQRARKNGPLTRHDSEEGSLTASCPVDRVVAVARYWRSGAHSTPAQQTQRGDRPGTTAL